MARNKYDVDETLEKDAEFDFRRLTRMSKYVKPYSRQITLTSMTMLLSAAVSMAGPFLFKLALDEAIPRRDVSYIVILSLLYTASILINVLLYRYRLLNMSRVGQGVISDLRRDVFEKLQRLPFGYYDSRPHGKILVRVVNYINSLSDMLSNGIVNMITDIFTLIIIVVIMLLMDVRLTLFSLAGLPPLMLAITIIKIKQRRAWRLQSVKNSNMNAYIHESISGVRIAQSFVREGKNISIFEEVAESVRDTWMKAIRVMLFMGPAADNISVWTTALIYFAGIILLSGGANPVTVGTLAAFVSYSGRFWQPINNLANLYNQIVVNMTYLERIFEVVDEPEIVKNVEGAVQMPEITGRIVFENVTFAYDETPVLKDVSFTAEQGETIAFVGPTGAGKTTIVNLLSRFYDVNAGRVLIDGTDIKTVTLNSLRSQMGIMLQDSFIFAGTVMDNIRYGRLDAPDEDVIEAAKAVHAHEFIMEMDKGYMTEINERGSRLSVGQRQLISFARALLADPKVLILDEATSSIDTQTELYVQQGLSRLLKGRTSFIIAHRLSTIKNADRIMYIDGGKIQESGTHDELMAKKGSYYKLYIAQYAFLCRAT